MHIIAIASGKGGVGKSLLSANLALALAQAGKKIILADLDLGGSNLHLILGHRSTQGVGSFLNNRNLELEDITYRTEYENLLFIPGEAELPGAANVLNASKNKLIRNLVALDADYLVLDLGAGTSFITIDFFLVAGYGIIVTTPTLTSTLNAYLFLKNVVFRVLNSVVKRNTPVYNYLEKLRKDGISLQKIHIKKLLENIKEIDSEVYNQYREKAQYIHPHLIMNMLDDPKDLVKSKKLKLSVEEHLMIRLDHLGVIYRDDAQARALNSQLPILKYKPKSVLSQAIYRIADKILEKETETENSIMPEESDNSFQVAEIEAELDLAAKIESVEELLHSGALSYNDLIDTIKSQQFEIKQLRKENRFLKSKIVKAAEAGFLA